jgi:hypothetical protein
MELEMLGCVGFAVKPLLLWRRLIVTKVIIFNEL